METLLKNLASAGFPLPSAPTTRTKEQTQDSPCHPPLLHKRRNRRRIPLAIRPYDTGEGTDTGFPLPSAPTTRANEQTQDSPCHPPTTRAKEQTQDSPCHPPTTQAKEQTQDSPCYPPLRHRRRNRRRIPLAICPYDTGEGTDT